MKLRMTRTVSGMWGRESAGQEFHHRDVLEVNAAPAGRRSAVFTMRPLPAVQDHVASGRFVHEVRFDDASPALVDNLQQAMAVNRLGDDMKDGVHHVALPGLSGLTGQITRGADTKKGAGGGASEISLRVAYGRSV